MTSVPERDPVQVGILGVGAITQVVHLPMFCERPDVDVIAVSDPDTLKAEALAVRFPGAACPVRRGDPCGQ